MKGFKTSEAKDISSFLENHLKIAQLLEPCGLGTSYPLEERYAPRGRKLFPEPAYAALLCRKKTSEQSEQVYAVPYEPSEQTYAPLCRKLLSDPVISITQPSPLDGDGANDGYMSQFTN